MKRLLLFLLLTILIFPFAGCSFNNNATANELSVYKNEALGITIKYPSKWKPNKKTSLLGNMASHYFNDTGFFAFNVLSSNDQDLETIAKNESEKGDYGTTPMIEKIIQNAKVGYLIIPSSDQLPEEKQRSCFVTDLQNIYFSENEEYDILILFADQQHIREIIGSLEYL